MVRREIDIDEETDRLLTDLAQDYDGDAGKALADLVRARGSLESLAAESEEAHRASLLGQVERSERGFREGRATPWDEVKRRNRL